MTLATKVSACMDCGTPIIGGRPRCPACHDMVTAPRPRIRTALDRLVVVLEVLGIVFLAIVLLTKGCS